ncbi:holo-ACP synthase [Spiroplasma endosymbiont of Dioctria linearis]|uniref:holo-ACP synthase n=1 Tax=Spiroplasma endosymbiont of Dioctria linearis TaxID=3066290 RepID=UPI00313C3C1A
MAKIGIDIVENERISLNESFLKKFLHIDEISLLNNLESNDAKLQFASGRWAAKEALIKCLEKPLKISEINIIYNKNKPIIENKEFKNIELSISHEKKYSVAVALNL